jgi:hypothetical protein
MRRGPVLVCIAVAAVGTGVSALASNGSAPRDSDARGRTGARPLDPDDDSAHAAPASATTVNGSPAGDRPETVTPPGTIGAPVRYTERTGLVRPNALREPAEILAAIRERYGGSAIIEAKFGPPPDTWTGTEDPSIPLPRELVGGRWLYTTVAAPALGAAAVRVIWEANLLAGALREELHLAGIAGALIAANVSVRLPDGTLHRNAGGGMGHVAYGQRFADGDPAAIEADIRRAAAKHGLKIESIEVFRPLQPAPAIVVRVDDPVAFLADSNLIVRDLFGGVARYEGQYLQANDRAGAPVFVQAADFRTGVGQQWIRPDLDPRRHAFAARDGRHPGERPDNRDDGEHD